jgi:D-proline reductase (dithiol) PrdB
VGLIQRVLDLNGIATISLTLVKEMTQLVKPSKALYVQHPFGLTLGDVGDATTHSNLFRDCLKYAEQEHAPGTIIDLPYVWSKDDLRERQLRKEAH